MSSSQSNQLFFRSLISVIGLLLAVLQSTGAIKLDSIALTLCAFALLPWLAGILSKAELPGGWKLEFIQQIKEEQDRQRDEIAKLRFLIEGFVTESEFNILRKLNSSEPYLVKVDNTSHFFSNELGRLRNLGLIANPPNRGRRSLLVNDGQSREVKEYFFLTDKGKSYLKFRDSEPEPN
jgi:hypothetical protein